MAWDMGGQERWHVAVYVALLEGQGRLLEKAICKQNVHAPTVAHPELKSREFIQSVAEGTVTCLPQPGFVPK